VLTTRNPGDQHGEISALSSAEVDQLVAYLLQIDGHEAPERLPFEPAPSTETRGCRVGTTAPSALWLLVLFGLTRRRRSPTKRRH